MATAGHSVVINTGASATPSDEICGVRNASLERSVNLLDKTALCDGQDRKRLQGLQDAAISLGGDLDVDDTGQDHLLNNLLDGTNLFVQYLADGTNGYEFQMNCESFSLSIDADGKVEFSASLVANDSGGVTDIGSP